MQGFVSRLAATRSGQGNQEKQVEDVYAEEEEQERNGVLEKVSAQLSPRHQFAMIPIACATSHETRNCVSVVILKGILRYFEVPFASRYRKKNLVVNLSAFLEGCECRR